MLGERQAKDQGEVKVVTRGTREGAPPPPAPGRLFTGENERAVGCAFVGFPARKTHRGIDGRPVDEKAADRLRRQKILERPSIEA